MDGWNTTFLLGRPIFRGYVSFRVSSQVCDVSAMSTGESVQYCPVVAGSAATGGIRVGKVLKWPYTPENPYLEDHPS